MEDEERLARVLLRGLREEGHTVDHTSRVADARTQLDQLGYDVVVLDWMLPGQSGIELCAAIRRASAPDAASGFSVITTRMDLPSGSVTQSPGTQV